MQLRHSIRREVEGDRHRKGAVDLTCLVRLGERWVQERNVAGPEASQLGRAGVGNDPPVDAPGQVGTHVVHDVARVVPHPLGKAPSAANHDHLQPADSTKHNPVGSNGRRISARLTYGRWPSVKCHTRQQGAAWVFGSFLFFLPSRHAHAAPWRRRSPRVCCVEDHVDDAWRPQPRSPTLPPFVGWLGDQTGLRRGC